MMTWRELHGAILKRAVDEPEFMDDNVTVYDAADGEYYPADTIEFEEADDVLNAGHMFISVNVENENEN
tara:strand:- start:601 stop:807 length:207 start_codon:yes stop_codon:yes gene_type:complete